MLAVASLLSLALFLVFGTLGVQKTREADDVSQLVEHLNLSRQKLAIVAIVEMVIAVVIVVGATAKPTQALGTVSEVGAALGGALMLYVVVRQLRHRAAWKSTVVAAVIVVMCVAALTLRLVA